MNILVIDEEFPFPLNTGKRIRSFNLIKELTRNNNVSYLAFGTKDSESFQFLKDNKIMPLVVPPRNMTQQGIKFYLRLLLNLCSQYPYIVTSHYNKLFKSKFYELIKNNKYDIIICEWTPYAIYLKDLDRIQKQKSIIVTHNIESRIWERLKNNEKNLPKKIYIGLQYNKIAKFESRCFFWTNGVTAVSQNEADQLKSFGFKSPIAIIDNGVDIDYFKPENNKVTGSKLVFTGSMDWRPNQDAAIYFCENIYPKLKSLQPDITATFVGRNPPPFIQKLSDLDGITITGTVDDVRPFIAGASIYIVPLRIGGGSRLKILEALAMKKAVVSTTVGAEGLKVINGENIILADEPDKFIEKILLLLENEALNKNLGEAGRKLVENHYTWTSIGLNLEQFLINVVTND